MNQPWIHVQRCQSGIVHLSVGAVTLRLDEEGLQCLAQVLQHSLQPKGFSKGGDAGQPHQRRIHQLTLVPVER